MPALTRCKRLNLSANDPAFCKGLIEDALRRARRVMEGTDPVSSSRRSMQTALAMEIKLAEEERRRLEAQRHDRLLSYAAAQPLPDEAVPAPGMHPCNCNCHYHSTCPVILLQLRHFWLAWCRLCRPQHAKLALYCIRMLYDVTDVRNPCSMQHWLISQEKVLACLGNVSGIMC